MSRGRKTLHCYDRGWYVCLAIYAMEPQGASSGGGDLKGFETLDEVPVQLLRKPIMANSRIRRPNPHR